MKVTKSSIYDNAELQCCTELWVVICIWRKEAYHCTLHLYSFPLPSFPFPSIMKFFCFAFPRMKTKDEGKTSKRKAKNKVVHTLSCHINCSLPTHILFFLARLLELKEKQLWGGEPGVNRCAKRKHHSRHRAAITSAAPKFMRSYIPQPKY